MAAMSASRSRTLLLLIGFTLGCAVHHDTPAAPTSAPAATPPVATSAPASAAATPSSAGLRHPGILVNSAQLAWMKKQVASNAEPWAGMAAKMKESPFGALDRPPMPRPLIECGPYSMPNIGCSDERDDAVAAYTQALLWSATGDPAYARKAVAIMNAWPPVL
jgi:hypothetical protein